MEWCGNVTAKEVPGLRTDRQTKEERKAVMGEKENKREVEGTWI